MAQKRAQKIPLRKSENQNKTISFLHQIYVPFKTALYSDKILGDVWPESYEDAFPRDSMIMAADGWRAQKSELEF